MLNRISHFSFVALFCANRHTTAVHHVARANAQALIVIVAVVLLHGVRGRDDAAAAWRVSGDGTATW
jgi:hypothetical protein